MPTAKPFGYWTWDVHKNGLAGVPGDPDNPAVVHEDFIIYALRTSRIAAAQFNRLFPTLLPEEQARLLDMLARNPNATKMISNPQDLSDQLVRRSARQGIRLKQGPVGGTQTAGPTTNEPPIGGG